MKFQGGDFDRVWTEGFGGGRPETVGGWLERHYPNYPVENGKVIAYHATPRTTLPLIKKHGLKPGSKLTHNPEMAAHQAARDRDLKPTQVVVLRVKVPVSNFEPGIWPTVIGTNPISEMSTREYIDNLFEKGPELKTLKDNKVKLEPEEREEAIKAGAVWHHGPNGEPTCAIWKAVVNGKTWYGCNTHRCYQVKSTLKAAIRAYHDVVEPSA